MNLELIESLQERLSRLQAEKQGLSGTDPATLRARAILSVKIASIKSRITRAYSDVVIYEPEFTLPASLTQSLGR